MTGKKYRIALIGAGRMGERWAKIIGNSSVAKLSLVVDPNKTVGRKIARLYGADYQKKFPKDSKGIDAFFIITPHAYLYTNAKRALELNKPVFIEKPGARNASELRRLFAIAQKKRLPLMVGYNYRFFDSIQRAKRAVEAMILGKILFMRLRHGHQGRVSYGKEWRMDKKIAGGGVLMDQGVHLIDLALWLMPGNIKKIHATSQNLFYKSEVEEHAFIILRNNKGQTASISVGVTEWKPIFSLEMVGEKGFLSIEGLGRKYGGKELFTLGVKGKDGSIKEEIIECNPEPENALKYLFDEFINAIQNAKKQSYAKDAVEVLNIVGQAYKSIRK